MQQQQAFAPSLPDSSREEAITGQKRASPQSSETATSKPEETDPVWHAVKEELRTMFTASNFFTWIAPTRVVDHTGTHLTVGVEKQFHKHWIDTKLRPRIQQCLTKLGFGDLSVEFVAMNPG